MSGYIGLPVTRLLRRYPLAVRRLRSLQASILSSDLPAVSVSLLSFPRMKPMGRKAHALVGMCGCFVGYRFQEMNRAVLTSAASAKVDMRGLTGAKRQPGVASGRAHPTEGLNSE